MRPPRPLAAAFCAHAARSGSRVAAADACRDSARRPPACAVTQQVTSCACRRAVLSRGGAPAARRAWAGQGGQGGVKRSGSPRGVFEHLPHHHGRVEQHGAPRPGQIPDHLVVDGKRQIELSEAGERAAQPRLPVESTVSDRTATDWTTDGSSSDGTDERRPGGNGSEATTGRLPRVPGRSCRGMGIESQRLPV